ncbi:reverse transcriptase domain-containing protein [Tanacetum coccineum]
MPTWCHMFNSTLIGAARVWFDELPPESIDGYKDHKAAFLAYFMQQKKYVKDPVEIHNIKQRDGETIEEFMKRFKVETGRMKGAPECMRISGFMHGVNNPELTKRLNKHVPKTMEKMMITTTAFIQGEAAAAGKKKVHTSTPKEILATEAGKFKPPPPMVTPVEKRSSNKFCDFHNDKGHRREQPKVGKKEVPAKDKSMAIYMIQPWHRVTRQKITQSFERVSEITFPSLTTSSGTEGPLVIEAEISGYMIHRMYVDGGSSTEVVGSLDHSMYEAQDQWHQRLNNEELLIERNKERLQTLKMENNNEVANLILTKLALMMSLLPIIILWVLTEDVVRSLSALIYCRDLDTITLRDLIDSEGKLIPEDPHPGVPRLGIPRPLRASMQDLYDRMGRIEIRQEAIERMEYR